MSDAWLLVLVLWVFAVVIALNLFGLCSLPEEDDKDV